MLVRQETTRPTSMPMDDDPFALPYMKLKRWCQQQNLLSKTALDSCSSCATILHAIHQTGYPMTQKQKRRLKEMSGQEAMPPSATRASPIVFGGLRRKMSADAQLNGRQPLGAMWQFPSDHLVRTTLTLTLTLTLTPTFTLTLTLTLTLQTFTRNCLTLTHSLTLTFA